MNIIYNNFSKNVLLKKIIPENETFKIALFTSAYAPSTDNDTTYENIQGLEVSAEGYVKGGKYISINKPGEDSEYIRYTTSTILKWSSSSLSCKYAVLYMEKDGTLAACYDLGDVQLTPIDNELELDWTSSYLLSFSVSAKSELNEWSIINKAYEYIKEKSDTELSEDSTNTIQNRAVLNSISGMAEEAIDNMFN